MDCQRGSVKPVDTERRQQTHICRYRENQLVQTGREVEQYYHTSTNIEHNRYKEVKRKEDKGYIYISIVKEQQIHIHTVGTEKNNRYIEVKRAKNTKISMGT
jgi:hypothetical protein